MISSRKARTAWPTGHDEDSGFTVFGVQFASVVIERLDVGIMCGVKLFHRLGIAVNGDVLGTRGPECWIVKGHPVVLNRDAEVGIVFETELDEIFDAFVWQEDRRKGEHGGFAFDEHGFDLLFVVFCIPMLDGARATNGGQANLRVTGDACVLRGLDEQAGHPDMEAMTGGEDAQACGWCFGLGEGGEAEANEESEE